MLHAPTEMSNILVHPFLWYTAANHLAAEDINKEWGIVIAENMVHCYSSIYSSCHVIAWTHACAEIIFLMEVLGQGQGTRLKVECCLVAAKHQVWKCAIPTQAWVLAFIPWTVMFNQQECQTIGNSVTREPYGNRTFPHLPFLHELYLSYLKIYKNT